MQPINGKPRGPGREAMLRETGEESLVGTDMRAKQSAEPRFYGTSVRAATAPAWHAEKCIKIRGGRVGGGDGLPSGSSSVGRAPASQA